VILGVKVTQCFMLQYVSLNHQCLVQAVIFMPGVFRKMKKRKNLNQNPKTQST